MRKFLRAAVATTVLSIGLAGNALAQEAIRFGVSTAVSGDAAAYGKPFLDAIQFTAEEFNKSGGIMGRKVQVIYYDDRGVPDQGLQVAKKLVFDDKVHVLQPGSTSGVILTAMPVGKDGKVAMWGYGLAKQWLVESEGAIFRAGVPDQVSVTGMAAFAHRQRKLRRVGILHIDSFPGESTRDLFKNAFESGGDGAKVVAIASTAEGTRDFSSQLLTLVACQARRTGDRRVRLGLRPGLPSGAPVSRQGRGADGDCLADVRSHDPCRNPGTGARRVLRQQPDDAAEPQPHDAANGQLAAQALRPLQGVHGTRSGRHDGHEGGDRARQVDRLDCDHEGGPHDARLCRRRPDRSPSIRATARRSRPAS